MPIASRKVASASKAAAYLGQLGGKRRAKTWTREQRVASAKQAALARWAKLTTPEQRKRATKKANKARWAGHKKKRRKGT